MNKFNANILTDEELDQVVGGGFFSSLASNVSHAVHSISGNLSSHFAEAVTHRAESHSGGSAGPAEVIHTAMTTKPTIHQASCATKRH